MKLVGIHKDLFKSGIAERQCPAFLNPGCGRLGSCDVDLVFAGSGNAGAQFTHDVLFIQNINESVVVLFRNKVTAIGVYTFLQNIAHTLEAGTKCIQHSRFISIRCTTFLFGHLLIGYRLGHDRSIYGTVHLRLHSLHLFHTLNLRSVCLHLLFHLSVGLCILFGKQTVLITLGFYEGFCSLPCLFAILSHF